MARTSLKVYVKDLAIVKSEEPTTHQTVSVPGPNSLWKDAIGEGKWMLFRFNDPSSTLGIKRLYEIKAVFRVDWTSASPSTICPLKASYNASSVTWKTMPERYTEDFISGYISGQQTQDITFTTSWGDAFGRSRQAKRFIENCGAVFVPSAVSYSFSVYTTLINSGTPYIEIFYDDTETVESQIIYESGPIDGYSNPRNATQFSWTYESADEVYFCAGDFTQSSAVFYWKKSTDENYTAVNISGNTRSVTIPANTFPTNATIEWYLKGTDAGGTVSQTEVYSFSTAAGTAYATARKPISSVEDGAAPITFQWEFSSDDGQEPSGVDLWWKLPTEDNSHWHALLSNASPVTSYSAAAGTFQAGEVQWIVRAYNVDGTPGPWSTPTSGYYSFICLVAPDPPAALQATQVPLPTITWQSADQQGYEVSINGQVVKKASGVGVYSYTVETPLQDGTYTISVRVVGTYGLWSQPSTITITVTNTPPAVITLTGTFETDAVLSWSFDSDPGDTTVQIYRDDEKIGETALTNYTDRMVLGTHIYYVILRDSSGNFSQSNVVTGTMYVNNRMIAPLNGSSNWLSLRLTENSSDAEDFQWSQTMVTQHVTGAVWPQLERSPFQDLSVSYSCAFRDPDEISAFEALRGQVVILKSRGDNVVIGMLSQLQKRTTVFYTAYYFTLQQIHVNGIAGA